MNKGRKETLTTRIISTTFMVVALAVFKPFGLDAWQWQAYVHLLALGVMGILICMLTDALLKYVVRKPRSYDKGVSYIIRRNLWFQLINTPLVSLGICLYRHFVLSDRVGGNQLSWTNFLETLVIIAFCSFAIGLYWRFKFRSRYLAIELSTSESLTLQVSDLLYIESVGNYAKVFHLHAGKVQTDMLRATSKQIEDELQAYPMIVRSHRAFLVNLGQVDQIVSCSGTTQLLIKHCHEFIPVSRSNMAQVKEAIKGV